MVQNLFTFASAWRLACLFALMAFSPVSHADAQEWRLAIGGYTKEPQQGISMAHFDATTGTIRNATVAVASSSPSFLAWHPNGRFLYAVNENGTFEGVNGGGASAFSVEAGTGNLTALNSVSVLGGPCHLSVDATGKFLLVATYGGGNVSVYALGADGSIGARVAFIQHEGSSVTSRQKAPHAHQVVLSPDNRFALVADLGLDKVMVYRFDAGTGALTPNTPAFVTLAPGAGPRHVAFSPDGHFLYVISELDNTVTTFRWNAETGTGESVQALSALPADYPGKSSAAEIAVHPNGRFVYGSNRGLDSIAVLQIDGQSGQLKLVGNTLIESRNPRHFTLDPSGRWLLVASQNDRTLVVFAVDPNTGALTKTSVLADVVGDPTCVLFYPSPIQ